MSIIGLKFGEHLADLLMPNQKPPVGLKHRIESKSPQFKDFLFLDWICILVGVTSLILVILLASLIKVNQNILFAMVFAPLGIHYYILLYHFIIFQIISIRFIILTILIIFHIYYIMYQICRNINKMVSITF